MSFQKFLIPVLLLSGLSFAHAEEDRSDNFRKSVETAGVTAMGVGAADFAIHYPVSKRIQAEVDKQYNAASAEARRLEAEKFALMRKLTPDIQKTYAAAEAEVNWAMPRGAVVTGPTYKAYTEGRYAMYEATKNNPQIQEYDRLVKVEMDKIEAIKLRNGWGRKPLNLEEKAAAAGLKSMRGVLVGGVGGYIALRAYGESPEAIEKKKEQKEEEQAPSPEPTSNSTLDATDAE